MIERDVRPRHIAFITVALYSVWTPLYFLLEPDPEKGPNGRIVEMILPTGRYDDSGRLVRLYGFRQRGDIRAPFVIYEGRAPLPADHYEFEPPDPKNQWRIVKFKSSDGSDPRYNERNYYAVLP
jgi:hypothetical protein